MKKHLLFSILFIFSSYVFSQGITNAGYIKVSSGAFVNITDGGVKTITGSINGQLNLEGKITFDGDWTNNSSDVVFSGINTTGSVEMTGSSEQTITGSHSTTFENLIINKSADSVRLLQDIDVYNSLTLTSGCIDLQNSNIDFGSTASLLGENSDNYIYASDVLNHTGTLIASRTVNNQTINIANLGFGITTSENLGTINVTRGHQRQNGFGDHTSDYGISRYYESNVGELSDNTFITMYYRDGELNLSDQPNENNLVLYQLIDDGSKALSYTPLDATVNTSNNTISTSGYPYLDIIKNNPFVTFGSNFTLGSTETPLPIELLYFQASCMNETGATLLNWATASEIEVEGFILEHSNNFKDWDRIAEIAAAGNSNSLNEYSFIHNQTNETNYYRLSEKLTSGEHHEVGLINKQCFSELHSPHINSIIVQNGGRIQINIHSIDYSRYTFTIIDILGRVMLNKEYSTHPGNNTINLDVLSGQKGMVHLIIKSNKNLIAKEKLILN